MFSLQANWSIYLQTITLNFFLTGFEACIDFIRYLELLLSYKRKKKKKKKKNVNRDLNPDSTFAHVYEVKAFTAIPPRHVLLLSQQYKQYKETNYIIVYSQILEILLLNKSIY